MENDSLNRAWKISTAAAHVGFDWDHASQALEKVHEEARELGACLGDDAAAMAEMGDLLFSVVNVARKMGIDPNAALAQTCDKFERRFAFIETQLARLGRTPQTSNLEEMDALWNLAKLAERDARGSG